MGINRKKTIALVKGDGSGPEMMEAACSVAIIAAEKYGMEIVFEDTPMGPRERTEKRRGVRRQVHAES